MGKSCVMQGRNLQNRCVPNTMALSMDEFIAAEVRLGSDWNSLWVHLTDVPAQILPPQACTCTIGSCGLAELERKEQKDTRIVYKEKSIKGERRNS